MLKMNSAGASRPNEGILPSGFLDGQRLTYAYWEKCCEKVPEASQKNTWEGFVREFFSIVTMLLHIPLIKQRKSFQNFCGKSLGIYLTFLNWLLLINFCFLTSQSLSRAIIFLWLLIYIIYVYASNKPTF